MGKKKSAALHGLSKKDRKKLEAKAAKLERELKAREKAKAEKKGGKKKAKVDAITADAAPGLIDSFNKKKAKAAQAAKISDAEQAIIDAREARRAAREASKAEAAAFDATTVVNAAERVLETNSTEGAKAKAEAALDRVLDDPETDAQIKARVQARRNVRLGLPDPADVDRDDADAVKAYNAEAVKVGGLLLTSSAEREKMDAVLGKKAKKIIFEVPSAEVAAEQIAEVVETERGREFAVGTSVADDEFGKPSEAPKRIEDDLNGNNQYKITDPEGKVRGYTRVTTYIDCIDDRSQLEKWKARIILEGVAALEADGEQAVTAKVRDIVHVRDVAIAKARKADRKGKLGVGQLEAVTSAAWSAFKKALNELADEAFEAGDGREKAQKGTDIHALCALAVAEGIDAVGAKLEAEEITPADLADVEAFLRALDKLGAKVVGTEMVVVRDDLKVAGRLDYVLLVKLPGAQRATRIVADLKTGSVDYSVGKIARQLEMYAGGTPYDEATGSRSPFTPAINRTKALLFHLPAGSANVTVHLVDLGLGRVGNKLAGDVRAFRNEGKKAIDLKVNLLDLVETEAAAS